MAKMAGLGDLGRSLEDIASKLDKLSSLKGMFEINTEPYDDLANKLDHISFVSEKWAKTLGEVYKRSKDLREGKEKELPVVKNILAKNNYPWESVWFNNKNYDFEACSSSDFC